MEAFPACEILSRIARLSKPQTFGEFSNVFLKKFKELTILSDVNLMS